MRYLTVGLLSLTLAASLMAGFEWDSKKGYISTDGILEKRLTSGTENPDALRLMNRAADLYYNDHKDEKARKTYRKVVRSYPTSLLAPEAHYQIGKIRIQQGYVDKAFESFGHIIAGYPNYADFDKLIAEMFALAERIAVEKTSSVFGLWDYRDRQKAVDAFEKIVVAAPYSDYAPRALFTIAGLYKEKGDQLMAIDTYERLISGYPNHAMSADAFIGAADLYRSLVAGAPYDQGATNQAIRYYEEFVALYPSDERVTEAKGKLAQMQEVLAQSKLNLALFYLDKRGNTKAAVSLLHETIQTAPQSQSAMQAQEVLEQIANGSRKKESTTDKIIDTLTFWKDKK